MLPNKSLDASGTSGLVIDNLSVTWLSPAASTQTLGNIEGFRAVGDNIYEFSGEFGDVRLKATGVHLEIAHSFPVAT